MFVVLVSVLLLFLTIKSPSRVSSEVLPALQQNSHLVITDSKSPWGEGNEGADSQGANPARSSSVEEWQVLQCKPSSLCPILQHGAGDTQQRAGQAHGTHGKVVCGDGTVRLGDARGRSPN